MIAIMFRDSVTKLQPVTQVYRSFAHFNEQDFKMGLYNVIGTIDYLTEDDPNSAYTKLVTDLGALIDAHAPIKRRVVRGNDAPFVTNEVRRQIRHRSKLKNIARRTKTPTAAKAYTDQRNKCTRIKRKNIRSYFRSVTKNGGKRFWESISPFVTNQGTHGNEEYMLDEKEEIIRDPKQTCEIVNEYYVNIVQETTGRHPTEIPLSNGDLIDDILSYYEDHASVTTIGNNHNGQTFEISMATEDQIYEIMTNLNTKTGLGVDNIPDLMKLDKVIPTYKNPKRGKQIR